MEVVRQGVKESSRRKVVTALRKFTVVDHHHALVFVKFLDQHCVVTELVAPAFHMVG